MESRQFCSVCKEWLEMEIVQTSDGDDDGVVWFRCPQCQGFLPKLKSSDESAAPEDPPSQDSGLETAAPDLDLEVGPQDEASDLSVEPEADLPVPEDVQVAEVKDEPVESSEPLSEYAALLAEKDPALAVPYRPWDSYEVGQCLHHLAWDDCGVVVAKENLPGGREVIKVYFEEAGVVRLIEKASQ